MADVVVDVHLAGAGRAGRLWLHRRGQTESATFRYDPEYLAADDAYALDPALELVDYAQHTRQGQALFGAFTDGAPDGWGRRLIVRGEQRRAELDATAPRKPGEADFLLGARDDMRQGALRFRDRESGDFLAPSDRGVPPLIELPRLLAAAERFDADEAGDEDLWLLLTGGTSPGGARPKAHVLLEDGRPALAKFPSAQRDRWDVIRWEAVALRLADRAGIDVAPLRLELVGGRPVLVVERFDRDGDTRVGYASAMTMLERGDGDVGSYVEIAEVIETASTATSADLAQLWRRMAFTVLIHNSDDHLRNHGFLRVGAGWRLSPAFDLNPDPQGGPLMTGLDDGAFEPDIATLMGLAPIFRLDEGRATAVLAEVAAAVREWPRVAQDAGLSESERRRMAPAFAQLDVARQVLGAG